MPKINKTKFGKLTGQTNRNVRRLAKDGKIKEAEKGKIDTDDPLTKEYINKHSKVINFEKSNIEEKINAYASLEDQKLQADIQLKNEQALAVKTKRAQMLGLLIPKSIVDQKLSKLSEKISANILTIPRRGTARSLAVLQAELEKQDIQFDVRQIKVQLEQVWRDLISEALDKAKNGESND